MSLCARGMLGWALTSMPPAQDAAMQQTQQAHAAMSSLIAENKVLTLRAAAADEMKVGPG